MKRTPVVAILLVILLAGSRSGHLASDVDQGQNLEADGLSLSNNYNAVDAINVVGGIKNSGIVPQTNVLARFFLEETGGGKIQIGEDIVISVISPGSTVFDSVVWQGSNGSKHLYLVVDPENSSVEDDETDNVDSLLVCMRDSVHWVRMEALGLCHYASSTMLFNLYGVNNTVAATMEFAGCSHSFVGVEDQFWFLGGASSLSNNQTDFEFAGEIRNLSADREIFTDYESCVAELKSRIDEGIPVETNIDQYYLPQVDYDTLRVEGSHTGHWIVVTGYSDSCFIINDPGVGFENLGQDPFPNPENRGQNVIVDHRTFRMGVESTTGTRFSLLSYTPLGPVPPTDMTLKYSLEKNISRLNGDPDAYDPYWHSYWPEGLEPVYGLACLPIVTDFLNLGTFQAIFDSIYAAGGGDLQSALTTLNHMCSGMYDCKKGWDAAASFYGALGHPEAPALEDLFLRLSSHGASITDSFYDMVEAIRSSGGNVGAAEPYLAQLVLDFDALVPLEDSVLINLMDLLIRVGVPETGETPSPPIFYSLYQNFPNPFNPSTTIRFEVPGSPDRTEHVEVAVFDVRGRLVKKLVDSVLGSGSHTVIWDGRQNDGTSVSSGTYLLTLKVGERIFTRKMTVLK